MEIELFITLYVILCLVMGTCVCVALKEDNTKALIITIVGFAIATVILLVVAVYMAPIWVTEATSEWLQPF